MNPIKGCTQHVRKCCRYLYGGFELRGRSGIPSTPKSHVHLFFSRNAANRKEIDVGLNLIFRSLYHSPEYHSTMGKSQKKKVMRRHNPMRVPDSHLPHRLASASQSSSKSNEILPILQRVRAQEILLRHPINLYMLRWKAQTSRSVNGPVSPYQISSRTTHLLGDCSKAKMSLVL